MSISDNKTLIENIKNGIKEIEAYTPSEEYQHLLKIESDTFYFEVNCNQISRIFLNEFSNGCILQLWLANNRRAEFLVNENFMLTNINTQIRNMEE